MLPEGVHRVTAGGRVYFYWQPGRGTPRAAKAERIPHAPETPEFWRWVGQKTTVRPAGDTVRALIADYRKSQVFQALKPASQTTYGRYLDLLEDRLGGFAPTEITTPVVVELHDSLAVEHPTAANMCLAVVRTLFKWAVARGRASINPGREVEEANIDTDGHAPWPIEMVHLALTHCRWEVRMFVALAYYTGQRTRDVLDMRLSSIVGSKIHLTQSKTGKRLELPIHRDLKPWIAEAKARGSMVLVPGDNGGVLKDYQWRNMWTYDITKEPQAAIRRAGLVPHGLRKNAVDALLEAGCPPGEIKSVTGQSLATIEHYSKRFNQRKQAEQAIERLENATATVLQTPAKTG